MRSKGVSSRLKALTDILESDRPKSNIEQLCIQRLIMDFENEGANGLIWDEDEAQRNLSFFRLHTHWKGKHYGKKFIPEPWQEHLTIAPLFGWYMETNEGVRRRFRLGYKEVPRKNGKTTEAAPIATQGLIADREKGPLVFCAATKKDQALILFRDAKNMLAGSRLKKVVTEWEKSITCKATNGTFQPISSDASTLDGFDASRVIIDELHAHKTRGVYDKMLTSMGVRPNPLMFCITTAGHSRSSICWEVRDYARQVLEGHVKDDRFFAYISTLDENDDPFDPDVWWKANPNMGISILKDYLAEQAARAKHSVHAENTFRNLHLNQWTEQAVRWIAMHEWDACRDEYSEQDLYGQDCYAAIDLASTRDVNALALLFPQANGEFRTLCYYWIPEDSVNERADRDRKQCKVWADTGFMRATEGNVVDIETQVPNDIMEIMSHYRVLKFAYDPHGMAPAFVQKMTAKGFPLDLFREFRQTIMNYSSPCREMERLIGGQKLLHNGDPVLRWMASNVAIRRDSNDNIRPDKEKSADKIDGIVSVLMCLGLALQDRVERRDFYNNHEVEYI